MRLHLDIHDAEFGVQLPEFEALPLRGVPFWDETVLYHQPTQTLLGADIVCCGGAKDHWTWRLGRAHYRLLRAGARTSRRQKEDFGQDAPRAPSTPCWSDRPNVSSSGMAM